MEQGIQTLQTAHRRKVSESNQNFSSSFPFYLKIPDSTQLTNLATASKLTGIRRS
jgi:hypothetical protein